MSYALYAYPTCTLKLILVDDCHSFANHIRRYVLGPQEDEIEADLAFSEGDGPDARIVEVSALPPMSLYEIGPGTPPPV